ncbi:PepSY-associated TM helix domain-containing protein [Olivibacter ginsenosidimutans]|uniref:PepSY-associated TM helix domain-containing protein n=1 Tax=Olivibacter ginsenosidimutans TaxID=1176537 RepID=A0ABP9CGH4_9SPHI
MKWKKLNGQIHLWLGLLSGIVVFIVGITGCFYVFRDELIKLTTERDLVLKQQSEKPYLAPSILINEAKKYNKGQQPNTIRYETGKACWIPFFGENERFEVFLNPYDGHLVKTKHWKKGDPDKFDFFGWALDGHLNLWLPFKIGRPIVSYGILIFAIELLTGLILWWPKNLKKQNVEKSFTVKWKAKFKRLNYDLHNVLSFYTLTIALMIAITGLVYSFQWVSASLYWVASAGGKPMKFDPVFSDTTYTETAQHNIEDQLWKRFWIDSLSGKGSLYIGIPKTAKDTWFVNMNRSPGTLYRQEIYYFDKNTGKELQGGGVYSKSRYSTANFAQKGDRMNYDLHVGSFWGLPTKILWFFISFITASLPITGFLIWYNRKWGKKKKRAKYKRHLPETNAQMNDVARESSPFKRYSVMTTIKSTDEDRNSKHA